MKLFIPDPAIDIGTHGFESKDAEGHPFDLLNRKPLGERLSNLVERIDDPMVIALDGGWGTGKSFFLKLWAGAHRKENNGTAKVIYFDAFQHDYLDDPLVSLVAAVIEATEDQTTVQTGAAVAKINLEKVKRAAIRLSRPAFRIGLAMATAGASEMTNAVLDEGLKTTETEIAKGVDQFWEKERGRLNAMTEFREGLVELTDPDGDGRPQEKIVLIVDELDRCRPDYALSLVEIIKHFFSVGGVHFVLGTNLDALTSSVHARYGERIDAPNYLRKFIHLTMNLPKTDDIEGRRSDELAYFDKISNGLGLNHGDQENLKELIHRVSGSIGVSLRDIQRIFTYAALLPKDFSQYYAGLKLIILSSIIMRAIDPDLYKKLRNQSIVFSEVKDFLSLSGEPEDMNLGDLDYVYAAWARILEEKPSALVLERTKGAFGMFGYRNPRNHVERVLAETLDTFTLASTAE